ncbi:unnamed protein product [Owenia fusiformis]|uniref:Uncharacterized protein n=1 Tax=Owenia fusiformis TaxID=6347 RepID=A0A8J1URT5_OWEFU|nr:unnamed protein product [Owenia fusiformis]
MSEKKGQDGCRVKVWKQDPSVSKLGVRTSYIHTPVKPGPRDDKIVVANKPIRYSNGDGTFTKMKGVKTVGKNKKGDLMFSPKKELEKFDAVHTFAVVRQVVTMFERALRRMKISQSLEWQWGKTPITIHPNAGYWDNAFYNRDWKALCFFSFYPGDDANKEMIYTCRSFDIIAHETGHAVLDSLRPGWYDDEAIVQTGALHESFGDLTCIFLMLDQMDICEAIIAESKGNLHKKFFFTIIGEQFGKGLGYKLGLRNADNNLNLTKAGNEVHSLSRVFTGAVYDIMAGMFYSLREPDLHSQAETLFRVGKHICSLVIMAVLKSPYNNASFKDVAENMIKYEQDDPWKEKIREEFSKRQVLGPNALKMNKHNKVKGFVKNCCVTMRHSKVPDNIDTVPKRKRKSSTSRGDSPKRKKKDNNSNKKKNKSRKPKNPK